MKPLSSDLRERIVKAKSDGLSVDEICRRFEVSPSSVRRFWQQKNTAGHCEPKQIGGYRRSRLAGHEDTLRRWFRQKRDLTLSELQHRCQAELGVTLGLTALWNRLRKMGFYSYRSPAKRRRHSKVVNHRS